MFFFRECIALPENACVEDTVVSTETCNNSENQRWRYRSGYVMPLCNSSLALFHSEVNDNIILQPAIEGEATIFALRLNGTC